MNQRKTELATSKIPVKSTAKTDEIDGNTEEIDIFVTKYVNAGVETEKKLEYFIKRKTVNSIKRKGHISKMLGPII